MRLPSELVEVCCQLAPRALLDDADLPQIPISAKPRKRLWRR
jgi:hypothetical protein